MLNATRVPKILIINHVRRNKIEEHRYNRDDLIRVRAWWYKDGREIICKVIRHYPKRKPSIFDEEIESYLDVKPIEGYSHGRFIKYSRIVQEEK